VYQYIPSDGGEVLLGVIARALKNLLDFPVANVPSCVGAFTFGRAAVGPSKSTYVDFCI
jgi:hypothetical protein